MTEIMDSKEIDGLIAEKIKQQIAEITKPNISNPDIQSHPRSLFRGKREQLTNAESYAEYIMNIFDISLEQAIRLINMWLWSTYSKGKVTSIHIRDDGPGFKTGLDDFLEIFMKQMGDNKSSSDKSFIGEAGIGAKIASAKLAKRHHYSWSAGFGEPMCHFIIDEDTFNSWNDYDYYEEEYDGPSFFHIELTKLRDSNPNSVSPSTLRGKLENKFAGCLNRHPNVKIYTCKPENAGSNTPLTEPAQRSYQDGYYKEKTIWSSGKAAQISIGMMDGTDGNYSALPLVRISRNGVTHFETHSSPASSLLLLNESGEPIPLSMLQRYYRNILITIDYPEFVSTPIKNDLVWDDEHNINETILNEIANDVDFKSMLRKVYDYNEKEGKEPVSKKVTSSYQNKLDQFKNAMAKNISKFYSSESITNLSRTNNSSPATVKKQKTVVKATKNKNNNKTNNQPPKIKVGGKHFNFDLEWVNGGAGSEHKRSWVVIEEDSFKIWVNTIYNGYTDKISQNEAKESVYLADTAGHVIQDHRLQELLKNSRTVSEEDIVQIQKERDEMIAEFMSILVS